MLYIALHPPVGRGLWLGREAPVQDVVLTQKDASVLLCVPAQESAGPFLREAEATPFWPLLSLGRDCLETTVPLLSHFMPQNNVCKAAGGEQNKPWVRTRGPCGALPSSSQVTPSVLGTHGCHRAAPR